MPIPTVRKVIEAAHEGTLFLDEIGNLPITCNPNYSPHSEPERGASRKQRTDTCQHTFDLRHQL